MQLDSSVLRLGRVDSLGPCNDQPAWHQPVGPVRFRWSQLVPNIGRLHLVGLILACQVATVLCAEPADSTPVIVVTESRLSSAYTTPNLSRSVIRRDEIEQRAPVDTQELLRALPSVAATRAGGIGGLTFVSIRGGDPNYTLFLLDGIKLNDPTNSRGGGFDLYMIPSGIIDSVEVNPRPGSAVLGGDGLSGSVSLSTRPFRGMQVRGTTDSHGSLAGSVDLGGSLAEGLSGSLSLGVDDKTSDVEGDELRQSYLLGRASARIGSRGQLDALYYGVDGDASGFPEDSGGDRLAVIRSPETRDFRRDVLGLNLRWDLNDSMLLKVLGSTTRHREITDNPGIASGALTGVPAVAGERNYDRAEAQVYLVSAPRDDLNLTIGLAAEREQGSTDDLIRFNGFDLPARFDLTRNSQSLFVEFAYQLMPALTVQGGVRQDWPDSMDDETSLNLGVGYALPNIDAELSAHYGQGFKLPSMFALGHSLVGNPNLLPEYSESFDIGVAKRWPEAGVDLRVSAFQVEYRNLIDFDPDSFTNINRGRVNVNGVDARLNWQLDRDVALGLYATYNRSDVVGSSAVLRRRPDWRAGGEYKQSLTARMHWSVLAAYTGSYFDSSVATGSVEMPKYWQLDTALRWRFTRDATASFAVKNLLDDDYEESVGFSNGGITAVLGLSIEI